MAEPVSGLTPVVIALGSNLRDPVSQVRGGIQRLAKLLSGFRTSGLYATAPMYVTEQPEFVNAVCVGETALGPIALHAALKGMEAQAGRSAGHPNGPRELDLDLVEYGCLRMVSPGLTVPHPRAMGRRFVVEPWLEVADESSSARLRAVLDTDELQGQDVRRIGDAVVPV